jgi:hypothetical protein
VAVLNRSRCASDTRLAAIAMAFIVAIVGMPALYGIVMADSHCAITTDICHPLQSVDVTPASMFAPPPQVFGAAEAPHHSRRAVNLARGSSVSRLAEGPDTPPPERLS